ncbi:MAG: ubiquinol-cytochrome C chaperone family protein [Acetobacteraceae bacterium]
MAVLGFLPGFSRRRHERAGFALYTALAAAARDPALFLRHRVPDTLDGRFDALALYGVLVMTRLSAAPPPGPAVAQAVFDAMFSDLDLTLREMGAGDPTVPRKMKAMWDALHGRALAYQQALKQDADEALISALARNVWRGNPPDAAAVAGLARLVRAQAAHLSEQPLSALFAGEVTFLPVAA